MVGQIIEEGEGLLMKLPLKTAFGIVGVAVASAACGNATTAAAKTTTTNSGLTQNVASTYYTPPLPNTTPPKEGSVSDPSGGPTQQACWANGLYVGNGSLTDKQIIFADNQVNLAASMTPQAIRKNPIIAEHDFVGSLTRYASPGLVNALWSSLQAGASAGDVTVATGKNQSDPTGIATADFHVTSSGPQKVIITECTDNQTFVENAGGHKLSGSSGHPGYLSSVDTMQKTASGWMMTATAAAKEVSSCS